jgi:hypothetical protein
VLGIAPLPCRRAQLHGDEERPPAKKKSRSCGERTLRIS